MKVYHGSSVPIDDIDLTKSKPHRDFGEGFYVTNLYNQAATWAATMGRDEQTEGYVTEFEFNEYAFEEEEFKTLRFTAYDESWLDFVVYNRRSPKGTRHGYDIVEGPVADDKVTFNLKKYLKGKISKSAFLKMLRFKRPTHQLCFCTGKSLQMLEPVEQPFEDRILLLSAIIIRQLSVRQGLTDEHATSLYVKSAVHRLINDPSSDYCRRSWSEIYVNLLSELRLN
jgi:hypothetical protein